jgi:hypothetical protein
MFGVMNTPGLFDKIKKKTEWDEKRQEKKVAQIQKQIDESFETFKKKLAKQLGKLGLSLQYVGLSGTDAKARKAGSIIARFARARIRLSRLLKLASSSYYKTEFTSYYSFSIIQARALIDDFAVFSE